MVIYMLHFVLGTTGVGKTKYLYDTMCALANNGEDKLMFIVPDQLSFETEKTFLELLGPKTSRNIKVFGFSRLCDYVFEQTGNRFLSFADEGIRNVVMNVAIEQVMDSLELFSKRATATDLSQLMLNSVKEYKKCSITSQMLYDASKKVDDETLSKKLYETALLYDTYNTLMEKSYIDPLDSVTRICSVLERTPLFEGYTIAIDSYYGFTSQEYSLLSVLMKQSKDMFVALTTDNVDATNGDLFFVSDRTKKRLTRIAKENDISIAKPVTLYENKRFNNEVLKHIEENVFRLQKNVAQNSGDALTLYEAKSIYDEADFVARNISKLIIEENYEYDDIAVITRTSDKYLGILDTTFEKYSISYFMDKPQDIDTKPLIKFVMSCFDVISGGFDKDDVLSLLKTGLTNVSVEEIADFENYLFVWEISGKRFFEEFTQNPGGFADEIYDSDKEILKSVENTRKTIIEPLKSFYFDTKDANVLDICKALMKLINKLSVKENLNALCDKLEEINEEQACAEQIRLYNVFVEILDKMVNVIGQYKMTAKRFAELLHINFVNTDISFIPHGLDQVDVATADRSLLSNKKAVFVIGAIDGEFPHTPVQSGVYSDDERIVLEDLGIKLSDSVEQLVPTEKHLAYKALTSACDRLFVSYYTFSLDGEKKTPSSIVGEIQQSFTELPLDTSISTTVFDSLYSERCAFEYLIRHLNLQDPDIKKLYDYFVNKDYYKDILLTIQSSRKKEPKRIKDKNIAKKLFKTQMYLSASQVDKFSQCKFQYFCNYGLRIKERRVAKIDSLEYGTLMHHILEYFLKNHKDDDFSQLSEQLVENEVNKLIDDYVDLHLGGKNGKTKRFMYLYNRIKKTAVSIVYRTVTEFAQSSFKPVDFELSIKEDIDYFEIKVNDEISVKIRGSIDRVDIMEHNGKKYVRIVDYKTGTKQFSLSDVLYGINLQMLIYLSAVNTVGTSRYGEDIVPAGILYMPAVAPTINVTDSDPLKKATEKAEKKRKMHGIILDDMDIIKGIDKELKGDYIHLKLKGDVLVGSLDSLATLEQFGMLFAQVDSIVKEMALSLCDGDISAQPLIGKTSSPCKYCVYNNICGYEDGDPCINAENFDKEDVYKILNGEEELNGEEMDEEPATGD